MLQKLKMKKKIIKNIEIKITISLTQFQIDKNVSDENFIQSIEKFPVSIYKETDEMKKWYNKEYLTKIKEKLVQQAIEMILNKNKEEIVNYNDENDENKKNEEKNNENEEKNKENNENEEKKE